ncbi:MAG: hypothetical protein OXM02_09770 [Bacteroidota bacterium]|nr:hypothetical protein [Bacteroidota bacterium]MDE2834791.1 hypothetical protein [Bacteroidota bacterium]MDE2957631.1 hypothetical protein [Bacteroidota bacterium]
MDILIPVLFITAGFLLIILEVYLIPGFNVVGVLGFLLIVFAIGYMYTEISPVGGSVALVGSLIGGASIFYMLWKSGAWERFILATTLADDPQQERTEQRKQFLGKRGVAVTSLRPSGHVEIDGERVEVVTRGEFISAGSSIRVVAMKDRWSYVVRLD